MKNWFFLFAALLCTVSCSVRPGYASRADAIAAQIHDPSSRYVAVACHRGDWRNYPENSIPAIESVFCISSGIQNKIISQILNKLVSQVTCS